MRPEFDVAVVGSGPCGAVAARELARGGSSVVLLERERLPRPKTCGGGIVGRARRWLGPLPATAVERECRAVELAWGRGRQRQIRIERREPILSLAMRSVLDRELVRAATEAGAELCDGAELLGMAVDSGSTRLATSRGSLSVRAVVAADGAFGPTARLGGLTERIDAAPALECELAVDAATLERFAGAARFDFDVPLLGAPGYAWVFPKRAHLSVGVLAALPGRAALPAALAGYARMLGLPDPGSAPHVERTSGHVIPARPRRLGFGRGTLLVAGDAAGLAEPVTFEGISFAAWSGALAAAALLETGPGDVRAVQRYEDLLRRELLPELAAARSLARLLYGRSRLARSALALRGRRICELMADVMAGASSFQALCARVRSPLAWARLALRA